MIRIMPFRYVNAITDIEDRTIYLSSNVDSDCIDDVMKDEFAHIISGSSSHGDSWKSTCEFLYGELPPCNSVSDDMQNSGLVDENFGMNIGNITGIQNMLLDYHMLQAYRKFSQKILSTDGGWEVGGDNKIRLKPTPKGSFPVVIRYLPSIDEFKLPASKELCTRALIAEAKVMMGHTRRKLNVPGPDGGSVSLDGDSLVQEGNKELEEIVNKAIRLGEPLGFMIK